jgi:hypothetical protein
MADAETIASGTAGEGILIERLYFSKFAGGPAWTESEAEEFSPKMENKWAFRIREG